MTCIYKCAIINLLNIDSVWKVQAHSAIDARKERKMETVSGIELATCEIQMTEELKNLGFTLVSGQDPENGGCEYPHGIRGQGNHVCNGEPFTYDYNNGVWAIYDSGSLCWVRRGGRKRGDNDAVVEFLVRYGFDVGAYVPHSNACDIERCGFCRDHRK